MLGTGYFFFSAVADFGDCVAVLACLRIGCGGRPWLPLERRPTSPPYVGRGLVRYVGIPRNELRRLRKLR